MKTSKSISIFLTEQETYSALEGYVRHRAMMEGLDLTGYNVDDADSQCRSPDKGAYFFFVRDEEE